MAPLDKQTQHAIEHNIIASVRNILLVVLCAGMMGMGMVKILGVPELVERFANWGIGRTMVLLIGIVELTISICLFIQRTRRYAIIAMLILLTGAIATHLYHSDWTGAIGPFAVLNGLLIFWWLNSKLE